MRSLLRVVGLLALLIATLATAAPDPATGASSASATGSAGSAGSAASASGPALDAASVDRLVGDYRERTGVPGVVVTVTRADRVVTAAGYGHTADGTPIRRDTPVPVASLSKAVTAVAVLQLARDGRIALDRPVAAQLPEFTMADPRASRITVRELLNQTSGITDETYSDLTAPQPSNLAGAVAALGDRRLGADPGAGYHYHNANYTTAARLVEVATGRPFADQVRDRVFAPLGMTRTTTVASTEDMPDRARGYVRAYGLTVPVAEPPVFVQGAYGVVTTADDLARWLTFQNGAIGQSVLSTADRALLQTPPPGGRYAMGWETDRAGGLFHTGILFTHNAMATLLPSTGTGIAVVTNTGTVSGDDAANLAVGLADLARGGDGTTGDPFTLVADPVLAVLTLIAVVLAVLGVRRADRWAGRRRGWRAVAGSVAVAVPAVLVVALAVVVSQGRTTPWQVALMWPALAVAAGVTVPAATAVLFARARAVRRPPAARPTTALRTRGTFGQ